MRRARRPTRVRRSVRALRALLSGLACAACLGSAATAGQAAARGDLTGALEHVALAFGGALMTCLVEALDERAGRPTGLRELAAILAIGTLFALIFGTVVGAAAGRVHADLESRGPAIAGVVGFGLVRLAPRAVAARLRRLVEGAAP